VAVEGAREAVGEGVEGRDERGAGLELGGDQASEEPEGCGGDRGDAGGFAEGFCGDGDEEGDGGQEEDGRVVVAGVAGGCDAEGEAEGGGEEWSAAEGEGLEGFGRFDRPRGWAGGWFAGGLGAVGRGRGLGGHGVPWGLLWGPTGLCFCWGTL